MEDALRTALARIEIEDNLLKGIHPVARGLQELYKIALEKANAFIDSHVSDPDITEKMSENYYEYRLALHRLEAETKKWT